MISRTSEYALRAVVSLADHPGASVTTQELARETRVPAGYLSKVLQALGRSSLVASQRGLGGGFRLALPPAEISVLDVVSAVDPIRRLSGCPLGLKQHGRKLCPLHHRLDRVIGQVEQALAGTTIAELLRAPQRPPLCEPTPPRRRAPRPGGPRGPRRARGARGRTPKKRRR